MPATQLARELTRIHRSGQREIADDVLVKVAAAWPLLELERLDETVDRWLEIVVPLIEGGYGTSAATSAAYLQAFKLAETGKSTRVVPALSDEALREAIESSMRVMGPVTVKSLSGSGSALAYAADVALRKVLGSANRHILDGARETSVRALREDPDAAGWRRVGRGETCPFCRMLIGRGEVYSAETARFASHDKCGCMAEPAYDEGRPASVLQYAASARRQTAADKARVRDYLREHHAT